VVYLPDKISVRVDGSLPRLHFQSQCPLVAVLRNRIVGCRISAAIPGIVEAAVISSEAESTPAPRIEAVGRDENDRAARVDRYRAARDGCSNDLTVARSAPR